MTYFFMAWEWPNTCFHALLQIEIILKQLTLYYFFCNRKLLRMTSFRALRTFLGGWTSSVTWDPSKNKKNYHNLFLSFASTPDLFFKYSHIISITSSSPSHLLFSLSTLCPDTPFFNPLLFYTLIVFIFSWIRWK